MIGYRVVRLLVFVLSKLLWRVRIVGRERLPDGGPYVLAPSHRSNLDSFFAALVTPRRVRFMAKQEIWRSKLLGRAAAGLGAFPVDRAGADRTALRTAGECLVAGEPLVIFPEGTRRHGAIVEDLHHGAAYLASRHEVPMVPVGIAGSEEILPRGAKLPRLRKVVLVVGEVIDPPRRAGAVPRSEVHGLTAELQAALQKALDEASAALAH